MLSKIIIVTIRIRPMKRAREPGSDCITVLRCNWDALECV